MRLRGFCPGGSVWSARGKRYSARRRSFTTETLTPTEMNHEGHVDHEEDVFVCFVATLDFLATDCPDCADYESWRAFLQQSLPIREIRS